jgi:uncharacterized protein (DUF342 family)
MIDLHGLKEYMRRQAAEDKARKVVQVSAPTLQEALKQASIELSVPVKRLEYEVIRQGSKGFFGVGVQEYVLIVYEGKDLTEMQDGFTDGVQFAFPTAEYVEERDGELVVKFLPDGVYLRVTPPVGRGRKVTERMVEEAVLARSPADLDRESISVAVRQASGIFVRIGGFEYNPARDAIVSVDLTDDELKAYLTIRAPEAGGADITKEQIRAFLARNGIVSGMLEDVLDELENAPRYNDRILIAEGTRPEDGKDARIVYSFETDRSQVKLKEKDGRVDFKELNLVQNVVEGQVLARKLDPERGKMGKTVTGKMLPAKDGKDIAIGTGKNVRLSEDGKSAIAAINGQVLLVGGKLNVEPVMVVPGDVNLRTGNILFLGTVVVKGSVEDGFSVKAAGNIEIIGNVGKCELDAEGDIIVHQGITGKSGGTVRCGHSLWAKFIENARIEAGEYVVVSDGIINSNVDANKKILCRGKRASIVGGKLRAGEAVQAKTLGSVAGSETVIEVGYDPKSKERFLVCDAKKSGLERQLEEIKLNLNTLENLKKVRKQLPEDKEAFYLELLQKQTDTLAELKKLQKEIDSILNYLSTLKSNGKVSVSAKVYPGVKIFIKDAPLEIRNEFRSVTFILENEMVKVTRYEDEEEEVIRRK